jgi:hypothetical protein
VLGPPALGEALGDPLDNALGTRLGDLDELGDKLDVMLE